MEITERLYYRGFEVLEIERNNVTVRGFLDYPDVNAYDARPDVPDTYLDGRYKWVDGPVLTDWSPGQYDIGSQCYIKGTLKVDREAAASIRATYKRHQEINREVKKLRKQIDVIKKQISKLQIEQQRSRNV